MFYTVVGHNLYIAYERLETFGNLKFKKKKKCSIFAENRNTQGDFAPVFTTEYYTFCTKIIHKLWKNYY